MLASNSAFLDLRRLQNYVLYLVGIGVEFAAVGLLILLGLCIAALGTWCF